MVVLFDENIDFCMCWYDGFVRFFLDRWKLFLLVLVKLVLRFFSIVDVCVICGMVFWMVVFSLGMNECICVSVDCICVIICGVEDNVFIVCVDIVEMWLVLVDSLFMLVIMML